MKATIVESVMGVFGFDKNNQLVEKAMFPRDAIEVAKSILNIEEGAPVEEISFLVDGLMTKGYTSFVFDNSKIAKSIGEKFNVKVAVDSSSKAGRWLRDNLEQLALDLGFVVKPEQLRVFIHEVSIELAKIKVKKTVEQRDFLASQAIQMLDDLDRSLNLFMSRLREWFGLHYPELDRQVDKHLTYARLVAKLGTRHSFTVESLGSEGVPKTKAKSIAKVAAASMGADLVTEDLVQIQDIARKVLDIYGVREKLEKYVDNVMEDVAPNTRAVAGSLLGARLLAHAGGLMNLAKLPASTIQVLGAEKALFRSLKTKARPPKHGIIFQHPFVHDAKRWQRGKVARALAGKLSIAARVDAFKGDFVGDKLNIDLEKRIKEVKERYQNPPQPSPTKKSISQKQSDQKSWRRKKRGSKR